MKTTVRDFGRYCERAIRQPGDDPESVRMINEANTGAGWRRFLEENSKTAGCRGGCRRLRDDSKWYSQDRPPVLHAHSPPQIIKSLRVDHDYAISLTGSNVGLHSGGLATLLAGCYVEIRAYPLRAFLPGQEQFAGFLRFGGLPGIHQIKREESGLTQYLHDIFHAVQMKDVIAGNRIRDKALPESIVLYLMDNIGSTFSEDDFGLPKKGRDGSCARKPHITIRIGTGSICTATSD